MDSQLYIKQLADRIAASDDKEAYEKLFYHFYDSLYRFASSLLNHEVVADEIVSDVFVNIWRNRNQMNEIENLQTYLYVAVRNLCTRYLSRNKKTNHLSLHTLNDDHLSSPYQTPEERIVSAEMISTIEAAIQKLPPQCKLIFTLIKENGLKYKETAQVLNLSQKTVEAQMAIATKRIRASLDMAFVHIRN
ncbi:MAG: RNA polymerase sigma-70 factor [Ferruginibacter sp.]